MDFYQRLRDDHGKQRGLCAALMKTSGDSDERRRPYNVLKSEVAAHAAAEELSFYAPLMSYTDGREKARHSVSEHKDAADLIAELDALDMAHGAWLTVFKKFKEELEHHVDEEERAVFPLAQSLIPDQKADEIGERFAELKKVAIDA